jgi:hypothetical protein
MLRRWSMRSQMTDHTEEGNPPLYWPRIRKVGTGIREGLLMRVRALRWLVLISALDCGTSNLGTIQRR